MKKGKMIIALALAMTIVSFGPAISANASEFTKSTVYEAVNFRKQPSLSATILGIIYPGEIVYDCGINDLCMRMDSEFNCVYRSSTSQYGYCDHHYIKHIK